MIQHIEVTWKTRNIEREYDVIRGIDNHTVVITYIGPANEAGKSCAGCTATVDGQPANMRYAAYLVRSAKTAQRVSQRVSVWQGGAA